MFNITAGNVYDPTTNVNHLEDVVQNSVLRNRWKLSRSTQDTSPYTFVRAIKKILNAVIGRRAITPVKGLIAKWRI